MANVLYFGPGYQTLNSFCKYDFDTLGVTRLADCPNALTKRGMAWDGHYVYAVATDANGQGQIIRYDPASSLWLVMNAGRTITVGNKGVAAVCDGSSVFILSGGTIYGYNIAADAMASLAGTSFDGTYPAICWDYSDTLWILPQTSNGAQAFLKKYAIAANTVTHVPITGLGSVNLTNIFYTNGAVWCTSSDYNLGGSFIAPLTAAAGSMAYAQGTPASIALNGEGFLVSPNNFSIGYSGPKAALVDISSLAVSTLPTDPYNYGYQGGAFTLALNTLFTIYKADGVTLAPGTDLLQNGKPYSAGKFAGPVQYQVQAASPRQTVTVSIVNAPSAPLSKFASISASPNGPFTDSSGNPIQSVSIGPMNAGQKKSIYVGDQIPAGATPGTYSFAFNVTSA